MNTSAPDLAPLAQWGFTLIEVMLAVVLTGVVLMVAAGFAGAVAPISESASAHGRTAAQHGNAHATMREWISSMDLGIASGATFSGTSTSASFPAWYRGSEGWHLGGTIRLQLAGEVLSASSPALEVRIDVGASARLQYLAAGEWRDEWTSGAVLPSAIRIVDPSRPLVYWTGVRG